MATTPSRALKPEPIIACQGRQKRLRAAIGSAGVDGLIVTNEKDIRYLTDFVGHDSLLLVTSDSATIISDPRYDEFLDPWRNVGVADIVMGTRHRLNNALRELCCKCSIRTLGVQGEYVSIAQLAGFESSLAGVKIKPITGTIGALRMIKDDVEICAIECALDIQQQALAASLDELHLGMTELELSGLLDYHIKSRGATGESFEPIIGAGANSSIIHHATSTAKITEGVLLVDWGAMFGGYCGDLTRTYGVCSMPPSLREVYAVVLEAQLAAIDAIAPGKLCAEIDAVARKLITDAGYGEQFGHGLGHGLGMDVHESPYFNNLATDTLLVPGMVMTVEPGVYLPGVGGVRIEDDVVVTGSGCRVLSNVPKDLDSAVIQPRSTLSPAAAGRMA